MPDLAKYPELRFLNRPGIDLTYWVLRLLRSLGLVWDLQRPPADVLAGPLVADIKPVTQASSGLETPARG